MMQIIIENKEILTLSISVLGILLSLAFGGILGWRQKICLDYESRRDVAINILRDRFVQRTSIHYSDVAHERESKKIEVEEIYKRPEQQTLIRELANDLEDQNRVRRLFRWLALVSQISFGLIWATIIFIFIGIVSIWLNPPFFLIVVWLVAIGTFLFGFVISVSAMCVLDGRFFQLVHRIIEPEGE